MTASRSGSIPRCFAQVGIRYAAYAPAEEQRIKPQDFVAAARHFTALGTSGAERLE
jgi:hypothetical protein